MEHVAPIIQAVASLIWAGFAFTALFVLKPEIARLLGRLKKGKVLGYGDSLPNFPPACLVS